MDNFVELVYQKRRRRGPVLHDRHAQYLEDDGERREGVLYRPAAETGFAASSTR